MDGVRNMSEEHVWDDGSLFGRQEIVEGTCRNMCWMDCRKYKLLPEFPNPQQPYPTPPGVPSSPSEE